LKRTVVILIILIMIASPILGFVLYENYEFATCGIACDPIATPAIQNGQSYSPQGEDNCQLGGPKFAPNYASTAVCAIGGNGGQSGNITLEVSNIGGTASENSRINFEIYSSEPQYVNFTSIPTCAYTSPPSLTNATSCIILGNNTPKTFQFAFALSSSYQASSLRDPESITVVMYQTCCWP
jgi:hypothetical protein